MPSCLLTASYIVPSEAEFLKRSSFLLLFLFTFQWVITSFDQCRGSKIQVYSDHSIHPYFNIDHTIFEIFYPVSFLLLSCFPLKISPLHYPIPRWLLSLMGELTHPLTLQYALYEWGALLFHPCMFCPCDNRQQKFGASEALLRVSARTFVVITHLPWYAQQNINSNGR